MTWIVSRSGWRLRVKNIMDILVSSDNKCLNIGVGPRPALLYLTAHERTEWPITLCAHDQILVVSSYQAHKARNACLLQLQKLSEYATIYLTRCLLVHYIAFPHFSLFTFAKPIETYFSVMRRYRKSSTHRIPYKEGVEKNTIGGSSEHRWIFK